MIYFIAGRFFRRFVWSVVGIALLAGAVCLLPITAAQEKDKAKQPAKRAGKMPWWQKLVEESKEARVSGRKNGVLLRAEIDVKKDPKGDLVLVRWFLDYNGPRRPLTIFRPSIDSLAHAQCYLSFFSEDKDGDANIVDVAHWLGADLSGIAAILSIPDKSSFVTLAKGEVAKGTIEIPLSEVQGKIRKQYPEKSQHYIPTKLFGKIVFTPTHRGEHLGLDAWTGTLQTPWKAVPVGNPRKK